MGLAAEATAVVVDEWPLVRLGVVQSLRAAGVTVVAEVAQGEEGVRLAGTHQVAYLVLGAHRDIPPGESARRAKALPHPPRLLVLIDQIARQDLGELLGAGVEALLSRSVPPAELADTVTRVAAGERVVAPALLSLLVGVLAPVPPAVGGGAAAPGVTRGEALTRKELEVLARLAEGRSNREIAEALFITPATVKSHLAHIYVKLGVAGRQEAMARAVALGLLG